MRNWQHQQKRLEKRQAAERREREARQAMRTARQQAQAAEREHNRMHDTAMAGITLAHFSNGRDRYGVACCRDCGTVLGKGEGTRQERHGRLRMVCRDREACQARRPKAQPISREAM